MIRVSTIDVWVDRPATLVMPSATGLLVSAVATVPFNPGTPDPERNAPGVTLYFFSEPTCKRDSFLGFVVVTMFHSTLLECYHGQSTNLSIALGSKDASGRVYVLSPHSPAKVTLGVSED